MSHSPKIDEIRATISHANLDFVCITETWLKDHIDSHVVGIAGYNIVWLDRKVISHGGVCMYVRDSVRHNVLLDLIDENLKFCGLKSALIASPGEYNPLLLELFIAHQAQTIL
jgi:exonuclease III